MRKLSFFSSGYKWYFPTFILLVAVTGILTAVLMYQNSLEANKLSLLERGNMLAKLINADDLLNLSATETDLENPVYQTLKNRLIEAREESSDARFLYIMGRNDQATYFFVDSEDVISEDYSAPGDVYTDESPAIDSAFLGDAAVEGPIPDSFGTWISSITPLYAADGEIVGVFGVDVDAQKYVSEARLRASVPLIISFFLILFAALGLYLKQKESKQIELRSQFVAIASHEIRAPLTGIAWGLQSIKKEVLASDDQHLVEEAREAVSGLIGTVNDLLAVAGVDAHVDSRFTKVKLKESFAEALKNLVLQIENNKVEVRFAREIPEDAHTKGDPDNIKHVFLNILSNAIKYSPEGATLTVRYERITSYHRISLKDDGVGIPKEEQNKILSGFYRASNVKKGYTGSGLGLYFVKRVMDAIKGALVIESDTNQGTTITLDFPISR